MEGIILLVSKVVIAQRIQLLLVEGFCSFSLMSSHLVSSGFLYPAAHTLWDVAVGSCRKAAVPLVGCRWLDMEPLITWKVKAKL